MKDNLFRYWQVRDHYPQIPDGWSLCSLCGHQKISPAHFKVLDGWKHLKDEPNSARDIEILLESGEVVIGHHARDLSGENQPPFEGYFQKAGLSFTLVTNAKAWREIKKH